MGEARQTKGGREGGEGYRRVLSPRGAARSASSDRPDGLRSATHLRCWSDRIRAFPSPWAAKNRAMGATRLADAEPARQIPDGRLKISKHPLAGVRREEGSVGD